VKYLTAAERLAEVRGPKILLTGLPGVGKTTRVGDLLPGRQDEILLCDTEAGDLPIVGLPIPTIRPRTWPSLRDTAAIIGGANPARASSMAYSQAHFDAVASNPAMAELTRFSTVIFDSVTEVSRICRGWAEQQPESFTDRGKKDLRGTYGLVAREMIDWFQQIQHARSKTIVFIAVLENVKDDFGASSWELQFEGRATGRQVPAIVDEVVAMHAIDFGDGALTRSFICASPNPWGLPAKDRSGRLEQLEPPHLGKLLEKLTPSKTGE
jgi:hypothetical protein